MEGAFKLALSNFPINTRDIFPSGVNQTLGTGTLIHSMGFGVHFLVEWFCPLVLDLWLSVHTARPYTRDESS